MKNLISFLSFFILISLSVQGQTTFNYSGTSTNSFIAGFAKVGGIGRNNITTASTNFHIGLTGTANNATFGNVGVLGTTSQNTIANNTNYYAVYGDNYNNNLVANNQSVSGGFFSAQNSGSNASSTGVSGSAYGSNNSTTTTGVSAIASNNSNTTPNKTIAVRGETFSGNTTTSNYLYAVTNPGGYFAGNDGQGLYATTTGGYNLGSFGKISQAVTGYSNQASAYVNAGVVGYTEGTGNYKFGVIGFLNGTAGTNYSSAVYGQDNIGSTNTYAGYFNGKVSIVSSLSVSSTGSFGGAITGTTAGFSGCVTASNLSCPSDLRYKKNILPIENSLFNILKINGVRYDWKQEEFPEKHFSDKNQIGFIAQEIEKIFPEMVFTDDKGFKSVDYARLTPVLVEAIKELNSRNEKLEIKNQKLESRVDKIEALLSVSNSSTGK